MKKGFKFLGALLIAGGLFFTSCEKDELEDEKPTTEQTETVPSGTTDGTSTTDGTDKNGTEEEADFLGEMTKNEDGKLGVNDGNGFRPIEGDIEKLRLHLDKCVQVKTFIYKTQEGVVKYSLKEIKPCVDPNVGEKEKRCFKGLISKDKEGRFGIMEDNKFRRLVGQETKLREHHNKCIEVCAVRFLDRMEEAFEVKDIHPCNVEGNTGEVVKRCFKGIVVKDKEGRLGIMEDNKFHRLVGEETKLHEHFDRCIEVCATRFLDREEEAFKVIEIHACKTDEGNTVEPEKRCFKGIVIKDKEGRLGIMEENKFHRLVGEETKLHEHFDRCIEVCATRFLDREEEAFKVIEIVSCDKNDGVTR